MKLNLPSDWTREKIGGLLLLSLLKIRKVNTDQGFANCLVDFKGTWKSASDYISYDKLLRYPFSSDNNYNDGSKIVICCDGPVCVYSQSCNISAICQKISQKTFCGINACGGIVGNDTITSNTTLGNCSHDISVVSNDLVNQSPLGSGIGRGWALWYCLYTNGTCPPSGLACFWNSGGITCFSTETNCYLQWVAPRPSLAINNSFGSTLTPITDSSNNNNPNLVYILVPTGTVIGVASIGGVTYYLIRKKKEQSQQNSDIIELEKRKNFEPRNAKNELEESQNFLSEVEEFQKPNEQYYQTYIEADPSQKR